MNIQISVALYFHPHALAHHMSVQNSGAKGLFGIYWVYTDIFLTG